MQENKLLKMMEYYLCLEDIENKDNIKWFSGYDVYSIMEIFYGTFKLIDYIHNIFIFEEIFIISINFYIIMIKIFSYA